MFLVYAFLYIPIGILAFYSFNQSRYSVSWTGFTWHWYKQLSTNAAVIDSAINSFIVAATSATFSVILGVLFSLWLYTGKSRHTKPVSFMLYTIVMLPDIVMGISLLLFFVAFHVPLGFFTLLMSHIAFELPFIVITVMSRLKLFNKSIIEAAQDLGGSDFQVFYYVVLPIIMPAIITSWLMSFTLSLDDVVISFFVTGPGFEVLPIKIYSLARLGVDPQINALCCILFVISLTMAVLSNINLKRSV